MFPELLLTAAALTNFGAIDSVFYDFYPKTVMVIVKQADSKLMNMRVQGNDVTKLLNLDGQYPEMQAMNLTMSSEKGMWVKVGLAGEFPRLASINARSDKADMSFKATGKIDQLKSINLATRSGDAFLEWAVESQTPLNINIHALSGDTGMVLNHSVSQTNISSRSGEVYLKWLAAPKEARLNVDTSSGDIHVELSEAMQNASLQTKSGDIDLRLDPSWKTNAEITLTTKTGDIMIAVPKNVNVIMNANTVTGEIAQGKLLAQDIDPKHKVFVQQAGADKPTISLKIETKTGDILIH